MILTLGACCALSANAAAATPLKASVVGSATRMIGSDGARFAAWQDEDVASTYVYDGKTHKTTGVVPPPGCVVTAVGAGALVATCDAYPLLSSAKVLDLPAGQWRDVVGPSPDFGDLGGSRSFVGIGHRWIQAESGHYHTSSSTFYARADGSAYSGRSPFGPHVQPDLDRPGLRRPLCSPLRAIAQEPSSESTDGWYPLQIAGRFAIAAPRSPGAVALHRCGTTRQRVVCHRWCFTPTLFDARILWADDRGALHVRGVRARRTTSFAIRGHTIAGVYPAGSRVVLATDVIAGNDRIVVRVVSARSLRRP